MLKNEFLKMIEQDTRTDNADIRDLYEYTKEALRDYPDSTEIDDKKTMKECYSEMYKYAQKHQQNGGYHFGRQATYDFIRQYLGLKDKPTGGIKTINLEDFI